MSEQINQILMDIHKTVGSIEAKLDNVVSQVEDHAEKISVLEQIKTQALTLMSILTFIFTFGWDWIKSKIGI